MSTDIDRIFRDGRLIDEALAETAYQALLQHHRAGQPMVHWDGTKPVWLSPDEISARLKQMKPT